MLHIPVFSMHTIFMEETSKIREQLEDLKNLIAKGKQDVSIIENAVAKANRLVAVIERLQ